MGSTTDILAVDRGTQSSQVHQTNDRLLMDEVCAGLMAEGYVIQRIDEDQLPQINLTDAPGTIVSMAQAPANTAMLAELQANGRTVINSFNGVLQTYRSFLTIAMARRPQLPFAPGAVMTSIDPEEVDPHFTDLFDRFSGNLGLPFWLKRGDVHAAHPNDVLLIADRTEFEYGITDMRQRGVETAVVQKHIPGIVYKFYAVSDGRFFHLQEFESGADIGGGDPVLENLAMHTAEYLDLTIFGGDAVRTDDGWILIDVNAWPSFGTVRQSAVPLIVEAITEKMVTAGG